MHGETEYRVSLSTGSQLSPSRWPLDTFLLRRPGSQGGARCRQPSRRNIKKTHTHTHQPVHVELACPGNPQPHCRINYRLLAGGGHAALGVQGSRGDQCRLQRGPTYQTYTVHIHTRARGGESRSCHTCTLLRPSYLRIF